MSIERLDIIIQKTLPLVYDDSLSYLEFLAKVVAKVNEAIDELNIYLNQDLRGYVVQRLEEWQADGTLDQIISDTLTTGLDAVNTKIGDTQYTEQNYVSNGETITSSIDALDSQSKLNETSNITNSKKIGVRVNLNEYKQLKNGTDWITALNTALSENEYVEVNQGVYEISSTVFVGDSKLIGLGNVVLKPLSNIDGLEWNNNGYIENIRISVSHLTGYNKRCFIYRTIGQISQHAQLFSNITAFMKEIVEDNTSLGVGLYITNKPDDQSTHSDYYIAYTNNNNYTCNGGGVGLKFEIATNGSGWIQGNVFSNCIISALKQMDIPGKATGNSFPGYIAQFKYISGQDSIATIRGNINVYGWDSVILHKRLYDYTHLTGSIEPFAIDIPSTERYVGIHSDRFTVEDGMIKSAYGWRTDIRADLNKSMTNGFYEFLDYCDGEVLNPKWKLINATQEPLGVVDTRKSHGISIIQTDYSDPSKVLLDNLFMTRSRCPRLFTILRNRYGGDSSSSLGSITKIGFISSDENYGYWVEIDATVSHTNPTAYAVVKNGSGNITKETILNNNSSPLDVSWASKIGIEIITTDNSIIFRLSSEVYNQKMSHLQAVHYKHNATVTSRGGTKIITTHLPDQDIIISPTIAYNSALSSGTKQGKALLHFHVKSRFVG